MNLEEKYKHLVSILKELDSVAIGYSGGVDSTLLLRVAVDTLGGKALAVIGQSETYPSSEYQSAYEYAQSIGARVLIVKTEETDQLKFKENPPDRCYFCKTELFSKLGEIAEREHIEWIADGSIVDDIGDFRPGMRAKKEKNVRSPLLEAGFTKQDVRDLSKQLDLPTWDKQSFACLSSRFPYGTAITKENLLKVDSAENLLRSIGFKNFRVRYHDERTARIEIGPAEIHRLLDDSLRTQIVAELRKLGFVYITLDLQGYRTGSMNESLTTAEKERYR